MTPEKQHQLWSKPTTWSSPRFFAVVFGAFLVSVAVSVAVFGIDNGLDLNRAVMALIPATAIIAIATGVRANTLRRRRRS